MVNKVKDIEKSMSFFVGIFICKFVKWFWNSNNFKPKLSSNNPIQNLRAMNRIFINLLVFLSLFPSLSAKQIKLLTIGNSFSQDAVEQYLYELADANGDTIIIGNMYIGGCSLERHYRYSMSNSADYSYRKITDGEIGIMFPFSR